MGKQPSTWIALLAFLASVVVVVAAQSPKGTEDFSISFSGLAIITKFVIFSDII
jgi:hypothetical protein